MRPKRPTVPVQSLGLESRPGLVERRVFESGKMPIGSNVEGAHPRGPRDPGVVARRKKTMYTGPDRPVCPVRNEPPRGASRRVDESGTPIAVGVRLAASGDTPTIRRRARRAG